jgi:hypothetical protein
MVDRLIAGAEDLIDDRVRYAAANGLSQRVGATYRTPSAPWRFVGHTIEAPADATTGGWSTVDGIRNTAIKHRTPPHLWAWPAKNWVGQTVPLDLSAYALRHEAGDPETNHAHAIQLELLGFAGDDPYTRWADWIGERVLGPVIAAGVPINVAHTARSDGSAAYGESGSVRMSWAQWAAFDGICGHQNVPGNVHWDPGRADYARIGRAATNGDDDMFTDADRTALNAARTAADKALKEAGAASFFAGALLKLVTPRGFWHIDPTTWERVDPDTPGAVPVADFVRWVRETVLVSREQSDDEPVEDAEELRQGMQLDELVAAMQALAPADQAAADVPATG